ncbi:MAG: hypothetical protein ACWGN2_10475 [Anaerolineales bacterium]
MVDVIVRSFIGQWGQKILDFYQNNSLWINGLILLYFLMIIFSRRNYRFIIISLVEDLKRKYGSQLKGDNPNQISKRLKRMEIPWEQALSTSSFPFVTPPGGFRPYMKNEKTFQKLLSDEVLAEVIFESNK